MEKRFEEFLSQIRSAVAARLIPGAVVSIGRGNEIYALEAYGNAMNDPHIEPMIDSTVFDIASLSKLTGVWAGIVQMLAKGTITLETTLPEALNREVHPQLTKTTVFQLLTHTAGLIPFIDTFEFGDTREERINGLLHLAPTSEVGQVLYSDLSFIFLGEILARYAGKPLEEAAADTWKALGMLDTCYNPARGTYCAATEIVDGVTTRGWVHDERSQQLGGVAGHAGVFSTARDLSRFCAALLPPTPSPLFDPEWLRRSFTVQAKGPTSNRGLGWVVYTERPEGNIVGHTGFTGTSLWLDTATGLYVVLLTNRVHPTRANTHIMDIRKKGYETIFGVPYV